MIKGKEVTIYDLASKLSISIATVSRALNDDPVVSKKTKKKIFDSCTGDILKAVDVIMKAFNDKKKLLICGNGGSAADAQHIATEFVIRMTKANRPALPAIAFVVNGLSPVMILTSMPAS